MKKIHISTTVHSTPELVWDCWTNPKHIVGWAFALDEWECPRAENDVRVGGRFTTAMAAKDGSTGFDFSGTYTAIEEGRRIEYDIDDSRHVTIEFLPTNDGVQINQSFDMENEHSEEQQRQGWQEILNNFKKYTESHAKASS